MAAGVSPGLRHALVGRENIVARCKRLLGGGCGVVFVGPPGVGKTSLLKEFTGYYSERGAAVVTIVASASSGFTPLGVFERFISGTDLDAGLPQSTTVSVVARIRHTLQSRGVEILVIDDAHLLDPVSAGLILDLALSGTVIIAAIRANHELPDAVAALWDQGLAEVIDTPPLSAQESHTLTRALLGGDIDGGLDRAIYLASGGNPLFIRELVDVAVATDAVTAIDEIWTLTSRLPSPPSLAHIMAARFAALDDGLKRVIRYLAFADGIALDNARILTDTNDLERAESEGLLSMSEAPGVVRLYHPLFREVVVEGTPTLVKQRILRELTDLTSSSGPMDDATHARTVRWRLAAGDQVEVADLLDLAELVHTSDPRLCDQLTRAAAARPLTVEERARLAVLLAHQHRLDDAEELLAEIDLRAIDPAIRLAVTLARAHLLAMPGNDPSAALVLVDVARREFGDLPIIRAHHALAAWMTGQITVAIREIDPIVRDESSPPDARAHAALTLAACTIYSAAPEAYLDLRARLDPILTAPGAALPEAMESARLLDSNVRSELLYDVARGIRMCRDGYDAALRRGDDGIRAQYAQQEGWCYVLRGEPATGLVLLKEGLASRGIWAATTRKWNLAHAVEALVLCGRVNDAAAALEELLDRQGPHLHEPLMVIAEASVAFARGESTRSRRALSTTAAQARAAGNVLGARQAWYTGVRHGDDECARRLVSDLQQSRTTFEVLMRAHTDAWLGRDAARLERVATMLDAAKLRWFAVEAQSLAIQLYEESEDREQSEIASTRLAAMRAAVPELRIPYLREGADRMPLTPRELAVAQLAGLGNTDRDIADQLGISIRTVGTHLAHVYAKFGISGRHGLASIFPA